MTCYYVRVLEEARGTMEAVICYYSKFIKGSFIYYVRSFAILNNPFLLTYNNDNKFCTELLGKNYTIICEL